MWRSTELLDLMRILEVDFMRIWVEFFHSLTEFVSDHEIERNAHAAKCHYMAFASGFCQPTYKEFSIRI